MLDIHYSMKYETLIQGFSDALFDSSIWNDPFNPPLVIFSDPKIEKYFKLKFIKTRKNDVLMNFNTGKLEGMLFSALSEGFDHPDVQYERLSLHILCTKILNRLISKVDDNTLYYQSLNAPDITEYIETKLEDGKTCINQNNLYTFARNLSQLFNEYMDSRNDKGFHSKWMAEGQESVFDFSGLEDDDKARFTRMENWQKRIYRDLLSEQEAEEASSSVKHVTLAQLVEINRRNNGGTLKLKSANKHIFLLGFNSLGQFYRSLLGKIAENEDTTLHVYLQTNGITSDTYRNPLLNQWNKTGRDNFMLWETLNPVGKVKCTDKQPSSEGTETLLHELQIQLAEDTYDNGKLMSLAQTDQSVTICGAPSPLKEIEALHSSICSIIDGARKNGKPVSYSDFIVLSPDLESYKVPVMQVFDEIEKNDGEGFPYIPYVFSDHSGENSAVTEALGVFMNILGCNSLNRPDLFTLLRNPVVKKARNFSEDEISAWSSWVDNLNGFRNSGNRTDEWQTLTKRLLISTLTENVFDDGNAKYKPYSDMNSQDSNSIYKFVDAVDSLEKWRMHFALKEELHPEDMDEINDFMAEWLSISVESDDILSKERIMYSAVREEIENQKVLFETGYDRIDADSFFHSLLDTASESKGSGANMYAGGITFAKLTQNRTIPAKYVYILGLNSDCFPGTVSESSLDLRNGDAVRKGDDTPPEKKKAAFLCQVMAAGEKLYISYINSDLKKDAELFRSSVVDDIIYCVAGDLSSLEKDEREQRIKNVESAVVTSISIDEDRDWKDLFTHRSIRNKDNFRNVMVQAQQTASLYVSGKKELPQKVRITEMKAFLENPFLFYAGQLINTRSSEDEETENESKLYEPISFDILTKLSTTSDIICQAAADPELQIEEAVDEKFEDMALNHEIPDAIFGEVSKKGLKDEVVQMIANLKSSPDFDFSSFEFGRTANLTIPFEHDDVKTEWTLSGDLCAYCYNQARDTLRVMNIVYSADIKTKHRLKPYLTAMTVIAERQDDSPCNIEFVFILKNELRTVSLSEPFSRRQAENILNGIYKNMYYEGNGFKPFNKMVLINEPGNGDEPIKKDYSSFKEFLSFVDDNDVWNRCPQKELFNPFEDFGYNYMSFSEEYEYAVETWKALVPGLFGVV